MNYKRGLGIGLMFVGLFVVITNAVITGAVIGFNPENYLGLLGIFLFIIGVFLTVVGTSSGVSSLKEQIEGLESGFAVYETRNYEPDKDKTYYMTDPFVFFSSQPISVRDFKNMYKVIKKDQKLLERVREVYGEKLLSIARSRNENKAKIAKKFLRVLYEGKIPTEKKLLINEKEREEIKNAFNVGWRTDFNGAQRGVFKKYGLWYEKTAGNHLVVYPLANKNLKVITSSTPSDYKTGINAANQIIKLVRKVREEEGKEVKKR